MPLTFPAHLNDRQRTNGGFHEKLFFSLFYFFLNYLKNLRAFKLWKNFLLLSRNSYLNRATRNTTILLYPIFFDCYQNIVEGWRKFWNPFHSTKSLLRTRLISWNHLFRWQNISDFQNVRESCLYSFLYIVFLHLCDTLSKALTFNFTLNQILSSTATPQLTKLFHHSAD